MSLNTFSFCRLKNDKTLYRITNDKKHKTRKKFMTTNTVSYLRCHERKNKNTKRYRNV